LPLPTPVEILRALAATDRPACPEAARRMAGEIAACGSLQAAAEALANDEASGLLSGILAYRAALAELADPALRLARLRREAQDLDARAEPAWAEAAEFHGKARHRLLQGQGELAEAFLRRAQAAESLAAALEAEAFDKRLGIARLESAADQRGEWANLLTALAA
jgi:hypothetical protein